MKKLLILLLLLVAWAFVLYVKFHPTPRRYIATSMPDILQPFLKPKEEAPGSPFNYGEKFIYFYTMGPLRTGAAELTFVGEADIEGEKAYLVTFESRVGTFYDLEKIYAKKSGFYPIYIERDIRNFGITTVIKEQYDQQNCKVDITKEGILGKNTTAIKKESPIHNALLLIYYCRMLPSSELKLGYEFDIVLPADEFKIILTKIERIKVPAGTYKAYFFQSEPERIRLWIATDEKRTPLKMENLTSFGPSSIVLEEYR